MTKVFTGIVVLIGFILVLVGSPTNSSEQESLHSEKNISYIVSHVIDGDTVKITHNNNTDTIRLIGVDAPETEYSPKGEECFGPESKEFATRTLLNQNITLELDDSQGNKDKYGRTLGYLFLSDGRLFNEVIIQKGFAKEYTYNEPYKYQSELKYAHNLAKENIIGLWSLCKE